MAIEAGESFVVLKDFGEDSCVILGRNSLAGSKSVPEVVFFPEESSPADSIKCSNIDVKGAASLAVILNRSIKSWGANSGANEKGVSIGVSWTANEKTTTLLATDLARIALERSPSAGEAVEIIAQLNEEHGEEYNGQDSTKLSLLICDTSEAWIVDIVGKFWAAEKISAGFRKIPAGLNVSTQIGKSSANLKEKVVDLGLWDGAGEFNFRSTFSSSSAESDCQWPAGKELSAGSAFSLEDMFSLLREASSDPTAVQSSQVSVLSGDKLSCHWFTATNNVQESVFKPFVFTSNVRISPLTVYDEQKESEATLLVKYHAGRDWAKAGDLLKSLEQTCVAEVKEALASGPDPTELEDLMKDCVEAEVKFYR